MKIKPEQAELLSKIWRLAHDLYDMLEELRPGGGFKEYIDEKYCKECGKENKLT